eukprot:scaffold1380_cov374-Prasinococcus_capsulatus_cf.AAC.4
MATRYATAIGRLASPSVQSGAANGAAGATTRDGARRGQVRQVCAALPGHRELYACRGPPPAAASWP